MATKNKFAALDLLEQDHARIESLLEELAETTERAKTKRTELLEEIGSQLRMHAQLEEEIFYPALEAAAKKKEQKVLVAEAYEEHRAVSELVLPDLEKTDVESVEFSGRVKVLKELVLHHAEEEEDELFEEARALFSAEEMAELSERMEERRKELEAS
ncbi:MAG: hemerythrin domain-containing protein [Planctomycetota bacterium]